MKEKGKISLIVLALAASVYVFQSIPINLGLDLQGGMQLTLEARDTDKVKVDNDAILGVISVIRNRVDGLGVSEPIIQQKGLRQVTVQLPGIKDPDRAIQLIGETALLEFVTAEWLIDTTTEITPEQLEVLAGKDARVETLETKNRQGQVIGERLLVLKEAVLTGSDLKFAGPATNERGEPVVSIEFNKKGAEIFEDVTRKWVGKPLAILLDGKIISAPNINEPIGGGQAVISGGFSIPEMRDLVIQLKAGSLPVPVEIISNKTIGPTLGRDSIEKSKKAGLIGLIAVSVFMLLMYRLPGFYANIALAFYLLLCLATLKLFQATLTLPGIAGLILTMGMAVDANIIIFERIKEERSTGTPLAKAIQTGFSRALIAILDANMTTLIAAMVLFWLGTGTIKGFAVTLSIGILMSMFTAIIVTRVFLTETARNSTRRDQWMFKG